jgi:hypothetical protein
VTDLFTIYQEAYLAIRRKYGHPDEPVLYRGRVYCETLPPKGWEPSVYSAYFGEVTRLADWYRAAREYGAIRRKRPDDRTKYLQACDQFNVAGHDLRFEGEPAQMSLI